MVEFEQVGFAYGALEVLRDVTFTVEAGALAVLFGLAGAGKTTVVRLCRGELAPASGRVRVLGRQFPAGNRGETAALRRRIGCPDAPLLDHLPIRDNVGAAFVAGGSDPSERAGDVAALLAWMGLAHRAGDLPARLTPGERARAGLARAAVTGPELVLADEPTRGLPLDEARRLARLLAELNRTGTTLLVATEDPLLVEELAGLTRLRLVHLDGGFAECAA